VKIDILDIARRVKALGYFKPVASGGPGCVSTHPSTYWTDVTFLREEGGIAFFAHAAGSFAHYPKYGILRRCLVPCLAFVDARTHTAGYVMKKGRVYDLIPEAYEDDLANPWRGTYENLRDFPLSYYVNICDPVSGDFDSESGLLSLCDWYLDVVKVVVCKSVRMTQAEDSVRQGLLTCGLLHREHAMTLGGRPDIVEEFAPEIVDADELEAARKAGLMTTKQAALAREVAHGVLAQCAAGTGVFEPLRLERLMEEAFGRAPV